MMTPSYLSVCIDWALLIHFDFLASYNVHASADVTTAECHMTFVWAERHGQAIAGAGAGPGDLLLHLRGSGVFEDGQNCWALPHVHLLEPRRFSSVATAYWCGVGSVCIALCFCVSGVDSEHPSRNTFTPWTQSRLRSDGLSLEFFSFLSKQSALAAAGARVHPGGLSTTATGLGLDWSDGRVRVRVGLGSGLDWSDGTNTASSVCVHSHLDWAKTGSILQVEIRRHVND